MGGNFILGKRHEASSRTDSQLKRRVGLLAGEVQNVWQISREVYERKASVAVAELIKWLPKFSTSRTHNHRHTRRKIEYANVHLHVFCYRHE